MELMEETIEKPGLFGKIANYFSREDEYADDPDGVPNSPNLKVHVATRYTVTIRRQIVSFQDAVAAADGLKLGEQQVLNLSMCNPELREKIKDFMSGVNYTAEGSFEELGDNVFLLAPAHALVEVAPATQRMVSRNN